MAPWLPSHEQGVGWLQLSHAVHAHFGPDLNRAASLPPSARVQEEAKSGSKRGRGRTAKGSAKKARTAEDKKTATQVSRNLHTLQAGLVLYYYINPKYLYM
jgi:hypothetical protein